jgi:Rrf2 family transcriptional regulator, nitric oxide-sensitive transcriptional repressor
LISRTVEYALRAVVHLADRAPELRNIDQIAEATRVPKAYLSKVMQNLGRAGVVHSRRGIGGGMTLVKAPEELTLLEVVGAVEPIQRIKTCPLALAAHGVQLCPLHKRLDDAMAMVEEAFRQTTLAELLARPKANTPRCKYPETPEKAGR